MVEERLANAAASGELDGGPLTGKPLPDIDERRRDGWWAEQFVKRELSHDRRVVALEARAAARAGFWTAASVAELDALVADANAAIAHANINLTDDDQIAPFDPADILRRWTVTAGVRPRSSRITTGVRPHS